MDRSKLLMGVSAITLTFVVWHSLSNTSQTQVRHMGPEVQMDVEEFGPVLDPAFEKDDPALHDPDLRDPTL